MPASPHAPSAAPAARPAAALVACVLGLGVLFGLVWSSRNTGSTVEEWQVFLARFTSMAVFVGLAFAFKSRLPKPSAMVVLAAACLVGHGGCDLLATFMQGSSELMALGAVSVIFEGAAFAIMQLLYLEAAVSFGLRRGIVSLVGAYVVAEITYFALLLVPAAAVPVTIRIGEVLSLALLALLRLTSLGHLGHAPLAATGSTSATGLGMGENPADTAGASKTVTLGGTSLPVAVAFIVCLTLAWGLFAQMTGEGAYAFFDTTSEIVMVAVRILLVVLCLYLGETISFGRVALVLAMVWATGIFVVGLLWSSVAASTSALVVKAGLYALQEFSMVLVLRHCCKYPKDVYYVGGLVMCALMGAHMSRLGMLLVFSNAPVMGGAVVGVVALAAWFVAASLTVVVGSLLARPCGAGATSDDEGVSTSYASSDTGRRSLEFHRRFERFCSERNLTERERDVLLETLHGYTVDAVGEKLGLSRETVKTYLSRIYSRAGVGGRQELLAVLDADE